MMISADVWIAGLAAGLALVIILGLLAAWEYWYESATRQRRAILREAARWAVDAAELLYPMPGSGATKRAWVMGRLQTRFPEFDEITLTRQAERAVRMLQDRNMAAAPRYRNGNAPRYVE